MTNKKQDNLVPGIRTWVLGFINNHREDCGVQRIPIYTELQRIVRYRISDLQEAGVRMPVSRLQTSSRRFKRGDLSLFQCEDLFFSVGEIQCSFKEDPRKGNVSDNAWWVAEKVMSSVRMNPLYREMMRSSEWNCISVTVLQEKVKDGELFSLIFLFGDKR
ncbi:MAG: hypothetical protein OYG31_01760 [Candidatus Kaiserbacteria bacterium]|nr:hypothetical protein [Candidatus Kaiserbacteria bacterium]